MVDAYPEPVRNLTKRIMQGLYETCLVGLSTIMLVAGGPELSK